MLDWYIHFHTQKTTFQVQLIEKNFFQSAAVLNCIILADVYAKSMEEEVHIIKNNRFNSQTGDHRVRDLKICQTCEILNTKFHLAFRHLQCIREDQLLCIEWKLTTIAHLLQTTRWWFQQFCQKRSLWESVFCRNSPKSKSSFSSTLDPFFFFPLILFLKG